MLSGIPLREHSMTIARDGTPMDFIATPSWDHGQNSSQESMIIFQLFTTIAARSAEFMVMPRHPLP